MKRAVPGLRRVLTLLAPVSLLTFSLPRTLFAQVKSESAYAAMKDSAIRSLVPRNDSTLKELQRRLRVIVGPFHAKDFSGPGYINLDGLFPEDEGFGKLDGLRYESDDHRSSVVVTTRSLLKTWLDHTRRGISRDPVSALRDPDFYTFAINSDAATYRYATIAVPDSSRLGLIAAMLVLFAQDSGPFTPQEVIVTAVRGSRVFIVTGPAAVKIKPPRACLGVRDSVIAHVAGRNLPPSQDPADDAYRACYGERVPRYPAFQKILAQVQGIAANLPAR